MAKNQYKRVSFTAKQKVSKPVRVKFATSSGKTVSFNATKKTTKPVKVSFRAKKK